MKNVIEHTEKHKALKYAFYATIAVSLINIIIAVFLTNQFYLTPLSLVEILIFPILGFFTMKGSLNASRLLLAVFTIDRIMALFRWTSNMSAMGIFTFVSWTLLFWYFYYKAYLYLKNDKKTEKTS
jgi:hypothetical protein